MGVASMNCAATRNLHAGAFSKTPPRPLIPTAPPPQSPIYTHKHTYTVLLCKGQHMQITQLTSISLTGNPPACAFTHSLFEG